MILKIYKYFSNFIFIPIFFYFIGRLIKSKETAKSFREKFTVYDVKKPPGKLVWINAVSIGESLSIIPIIKKIKKEYPYCNILLTTSTLTSKTIIFKRKLDIIHKFSPIDINFLIKRFLNYWRPDVALSVESEIWPNLIIESKEKKIPHLLLNARISQKSFLRWKYFSSHTKNLFESYKICFSQDDESSHRFKTLGIKDVKNLGNLKFFSKKPPVVKAQLQSLKKSLKNKFVIILASSHHGEEEMIITIQNKLKLIIPNVLFILIPRHVERTNYIQKLLEEKKKKFKVRSKNELILTDTEFYLADTFGESTLFYALSKLIIIGGSFIKHGGHNPIEVSFFDAAVILGPYMFNFKKISEQLITKKAAVKVKSIIELEKKIISLNKNNIMRKNISKNLKNFCNQERKKERKFWLTLNDFLSRSI